MSVGGAVALAIDERPEPLALDDVHRRAERERSNDGEIRSGTGAEVQAATSDDTMREARRGVHDLRRSKLCLCALASFGFRNLAVFGFAGRQRPQFIAVVGFQRCVHPSRCRWSSSHMSLLLKNDRPKIMRQNKETRAASIQ